MTTDTSNRARATPEAVEAIRRLVAERGPVMFVQSGGCCDGSLPMCFAMGEFVTGPNDICLGEVEGCPVYIDFRQYEVWKDSTMILDVGSGEPEGFSLPAGENRHFVSRPEIACPSPS